ncbi:hypothetical protein [Salibacterium lacus]|uniref:DUF4306 domain-containing protein n=1 Tax=Salibacterium lacus TaxID=1898109 RepID=A0ABW5SX86_9BACI
MKRILQIIGIVFIASGLIFGLTQISNLNEQHETVQYWKDSADESYDNELIQQEYRTIQSAYKTDLTLTLGTVLSGIISGVFFLALATIIALLQRIVRNTEVESNTSTYQQNNVAE